MTSPLYKPGELDAARASRSPAAPAFALVELADQDALRAAVGHESFKLLSEEFRERIAQWVRNADRSRALDGNRVLIAFQGVRSRAQVELAAAKLRRLLETPLDVVGEEVDVEVNVGFVLPDETRIDAREGLRRAEIALSDARRDGRPFAIFEPGAVNTRSSTWKLVRELEHAVQLGEFVAWYQPKIHAGFRTLVGAEALLRWHRSDGKVVPPAVFIDVAERHRVIEPITWFMLKAAIARCASWPGETTVAVNVPPNLLLDGKLGVVIDDALQIHGLAPARLTVEVTEGIMVDDTDAMFEQLRALRRRGVRVAIDDFGTGYSSLAYFRELPADELKIDRCFVMNMRESRKDEAIVKAVISLAHGFGMRVVAEGVETEAIADALAALGCDVLQGYWIDKPLQVADFESSYCGAARSVR